MYSLFRKQDNRVFFIDYSVFTMKTSKTHVLNLLAPLLIIGYIGGTICTFRGARYHKIYAFAILISSICSYIYVSHGRTLQFAEDFSFLVKISDSMTTTFLILGCISCFVSAFYVNSENFSAIITQFTFFDQHIGRAMKIKYVHFYSFFILNSLEFLILISTDTWIWLDNLGMQMYKFYFGRNVQLYIMEMNKIMIYWLTVEICSRHEMLRDSLKHNFKLFYKKLNFSNQTDLLKRLKMISNLHNRLCDTSDLLSQLYGIVIVFDVLVAITISLEYAILMISLALFHDQVLTVSFGVNLSSVSMFWIADCFVSILGKF